MAIGIRESLMLPYILEFQAGHEMPPSVFCRLLETPWVVGRKVLTEHYGTAFDINGWSAAWMENFETLITSLQFILDALGLPAAIATSSSHTDRAAPFGITV